MNLQESTLGRLIVFNKNTSLEPKTLGNFSRKITFFWWEL